MLHAGKVAQSLEERRDIFLQASAESAQLQQQYLAALDQLVSLTSSDVESRIGGVAWPGARPTSELDRRGLLVPFNLEWHSAQEARAWAMERLQGITTIGVDGSHIVPSKEFGVPISLVQIAWFENPHSAGQPYTKDVRNEVVTTVDGAEIEGYVFAESAVAQRRFALEMQVAGERVQDLRKEPAPVVFVDGSFVLSFVGRMSPESRTGYFTALFRLLDLSREYRIPVVGYVDLSFAADLVGMLQTAFDLPRGSVFDAQILEQRLSPLDRTGAFTCARGDVIPHYVADDRDFTRELCFVYMKAGHDRLPARLDFPRWILDAGLLDHVVDVVRAEMVVGSGYPYPLETADAAAVLTMEDRLTFYRLFHDFARAAGLNVTLPGKTISKAHRR